MSFIKTKTLKWTVVLIFPASFHILKMLNLTVCMWKLNFCFFSSGKQTFYQAVEVVLRARATRFTSFAAQHLQVDWSIIY